MSASKALVSKGFSSVGLGTVSRKRRACVLEAPPVTKIILPRLLGSPPRQHAIEIHPAHSGHRYITQDYVHLTAIHEVTVGFSRAADAGNITVVRKAALHGFCKQRFIVDHQDADPLGGHRKLRAEPFAGASLRAAGKIIR